MVHELKTEQPSFQHIEQGIKRVEIRRGDRPFCPGDILCLKEYDADTQQYSGAEIQIVVTHVLYPTDSFGGLNDDFVALSLSQTIAVTSGGQA